MGDKIPPLKFCPYCGSGDVTVIRGVPRCYACRTTFHLQFSRRLRKKPSPRTRKEP